MGLPTAAHIYRMSIALNVIVSDGTAGAVWWFG
jgi:hypothetical protein